MIKTQEQVVKAKEVLTRFMTEYEPACVGSPYDSDDDGTGKRGIHPARYERIYSYLEHRYIRVLDAWFEDLPTVESTKARE